MNIKTTFNRVNEESVKQGDFSETGWINRDGVTFESLDDAIDYLKSDGAVHASSYPFSEGTWYSTDFSPFYDSEGTQEQVSFHLSGFTPDQEKTIYQSLIK